MQIIKDELKKTQDIFKILELSEAATSEHLAKMEQALLMDMVAEAFAEKGHVGDNLEFNPEEVEDFLLDNYDENEIKDIFERISRDVIVEYFAKILKDTPTEKMEQIDVILKRDF